MSVIFCPACGSSVEGERKYCPCCGAAMNSSAIGGQSYNTYQNQPVNYNMPQYPNQPMNGNMPQYPNQPMNGGHNPDMYGNMYYMNANMNMSSQQPQGSGAANGCAITGMILGIVSLVLCCLSFFSIMIGVAGLILSIIGLKSYRRKGCAVAGIVCSIAGILLAFVETIAIFMS